MVDVSEGSHNQSDMEHYFYWAYGGRSNRVLQVFFFLQSWVGYTEKQKTDWLSFASQGELVSSHLSLIREDVCKWTVIKALNNTGQQVVAVQEVQINGLTAFLSTAPKLP